MLKKVVILLTGASFVSMVFGAVEKVMTSPLWFGLQARAFWKIAVWCLLVGISLMLMEMTFKKEG